MTMTSWLSSVARRGRPPTWAIVLSLALVLSGCASAGTASRASEPVSATPGGPTTLRLALTAENWPAEGLFFSGVSEGDAEIAYALHSGLAMYDDRENLIPRI